MKEDLCSIPVSEVFESNDGCPVCRMAAALEERAVESITGAAMMEPDVRCETNAAGFCAAHFERLLARRSRLAVALTVETHLQQLERSLEFGGGIPTKEQLSSLRRAADGCYVCERVEWGLERLLTTVFVLWRREAEFRERYSAQRELCFPHAVRLLSQGQRELPRRVYAGFADATAALVLAALTPISRDVSAFAKMYDYRNAGGDWGSTKDALERAARFLTGSQER